jgi:hypothetical protein
MTERPNIEAESRDQRFFRTCITAMAAVVVSGFVVQLAMGRSSFGAPLIVHIHAVIFMGWVGIVVTQAWLAAGASLNLHRLLGRLALVWSCAMLVAGVLVTLNAVRTGRVPFFFMPQHFLLADPASLLAFFSVLVAAVVLRRQHDWHPRLQVGAFAMLMGPGFGRLLPMPLLGPYAFEIASLAGLIPLLICMVRDWRVRGRVHPAWWWSVGLMVGVLIAVRLVALSPVGDALFDMATAGSSAEGIDGRAYPPPPGPPPPVS